MVNGVQIAHFFKLDDPRQALNLSSLREDLTPDTVRLEPGRNAAWASLNDKRWSHWHRAVLHAALRHSETVAHCDDGNLRGTYETLAHVPTSDDYAAERLNLRRRINRAEMNDQQSDDDTTTTR